MPALFRTSIFIFAVFGACFALSGREAYGAESINEELVCAEDDAALSLSPAADSSEILPLAAQGADPPLVMERRPLVIEAEEEEPEKNAEKQEPVTTVAPAETKEAPVPPALPPVQRVVTSPKKSTAKKVVSLESAPRDKKGKIINPNSVRIPLSEAPPLGSAKKVDGRWVCAKKNDKPKVSKKNEWGHVDRECCLDPDEIPHPRCDYSYQNR